MRNKRKIKTIVTLKKKLNNIKKNQQKQFKKNKN